MAAFAAGATNPRAAQSAAAASNVILDDIRRREELEERRRQFGEQLTLSRASNERQERALGLQERKASGERRAGALVGQLPGTGTPLPLVLPGLPDVTGEPERLGLGGTGEEVVGETPGGVTYDEARRRFLELARGEPEEVIEAGNTQLLGHPQRFPSQPSAQAATQRQRIDQAVSTRESLLQRGIPANAAQAVARMTATGAPLADEFARDLINPKFTPVSAGENILLLDAQGNTVRVIPVVQPPDRPATSFQVDRKDGQLYLITVPVDRKGVPGKAARTPLGIFPKDDAEVQLILGVTPEVAGRYMELIAGSTPEQVAFLPIPEMWKHITPTHAKKVVVQMGRRSGNPLMQKFADDMDTAAQGQPTAGQPAARIPGDAEFEAYQKPDKTWGFRPIQAR